MRKIFKCLSILLIFFLPVTVKAEVSAFKFLRSEPSSEGVALVYMDSGYYSVDGVFTWSSTPGYYEKWYTSDLPKVAGLWNKPCVGWTPFWDTDPASRSEFSDTTFGLPIGPIGPAPYQGYYREVISRPGGGGGGGGGGGDCTPDVIADLESQAAKRGQATSIDALVQNTNPSSFAPFPEVYSSVIRTDNIIQKWFTPVDYKLLGGLKGLPD